MDCATIPNVEFSQKIFPLNSDSMLVLLSFQRCESLDIHLKIVDKISGKQLCLTEDLLVEIVREGRKFWKANIEYPCANVVKRIHIREELGAYLIKYQKKTIALTFDAILNLEMRIGDILKEIRQIELQHFLRFNDQRETNM